MAETAATYGSAIYGQAVYATVAVASSDTLDVTTEDLALNRWAVATDTLDVDLSTETSDVGALAYASGTDTLDVEFSPEVADSRREFGTGDNADLTVGLVGDPLLFVERTGADDAEIDFFDPGPGSVYGDVKYGEDRYGLSDGEFGGYSTLLDVEEDLLDVSLAEQSSLFVTHILTSTDLLDLDLEFDEPTQTLVSAVTSDVLDLDFTVLYAMGVSFSSTDAVDASTDDVLADLLGFVETTDVLDVDVAEAYLQALRSWHVDTVDVSTSESYEFSTVDVSGVDTLDVDAADTSGVQLNMDVVADTVAVDLSPEYSPLGPFTTLRRSDTLDIQPTGVSSFATIEVYATDYLPVTVGVSFDFNAVPVAGTDTVDVGVTGSGTPTLFLSASEILQVETLESRQFGTISVTAADVLHVEVGNTAETETYRFSAEVLDLSVTSATAFSAVVFASSDTVVLDTTATSAFVAGVPGYDVIAVEVGAGDGALSDIEVYRTDTLLLTAGESAVVAGEIDRTDTLELETPSTSLVQAGPSAQDTIDLEVTESSDFETTVVYATDSLKVVVAAAPSVEVRKQTSDTITADTAGVSSFGTTPVAGSETLDLTTSDGYRDVVVPVGASDAVSLSLAEALTLATFIRRGDLLTVTARGRVRTKALRTSDTIAVGAQEAVGSISLEFDSVAAVDTVGVSLGESVALQRGFFSQDNIDADLVEDSEIQVENAIIITAQDTVVIDTEGAASIDFAYSSSDTISVDISVNDHALAKYGAGLVEQTSLTVEADATVGDRSTSTSIQSGMTTPGGASLRANTITSVGQGVASSRTGTQAQRGKMTTRPGLAPMTHGERETTKSEPDDTTGKA